MQIDNGTRSWLVSRRRALLGRYEHEVERADEDTQAFKENGRVSERWNARVLLALAECDTRALAEVVGAIERIDAGTYGNCVECGEVIAPLRLRVLPAAALCVGCAGRAMADT